MLTLLMIVTTIRVPGNMDSSMRGFLLIFSVMAFKVMATDEVIKILSLAQPTSSMIVIYDKYCENEMENVSEALSKQWIPVLLMETRDALSHLTTYLPQVLLKESFERIHIVYSFLVLCTHNVTTLLKEVEEIDKKFGLEIVLRHFSTWLFMCDDLSFQQLNETTLDNVALMPTIKMPGIKTLMWKNGGRQFETIAFKPFLQFEDVYPNTKLGLNGRTLLIGTMNWPPFITKINITGSVDYKGLGREILNYLAEKYNFTYTFVEPIEKYWGEKIGNNTWTGFISMLQRRVRNTPAQDGKTSAVCGHGFSISNEGKNGVKQIKDLLGNSYQDYGDHPITSTQNEVDVGLSYYAFNEERGRVIEYSYFFYHEVLKVVYRKPDVDQDRTWRLLVSIFRWKVYLCGAVTAVVVVILLVFFEKWSCGSNLDTWRRMVPDMISFGINVPLRQSSHIILQSGAGLVLLCFWWLFCIIITSVYTGNLTAVITVEREKVPFSNLEELSENREYEVGLVEGSFFKEILKQSTMNSYKKIWEKVQRNSIDESQDLITQRKQIKTLTEQGKFALFSTSGSIRVVLGTTCGLSEMAGFGIPHSSSIIFPRHSPLARLFSADLQWLFEVGWLTATEERFREKDVDCFVSDKGRQPLMLNDLLLALVACGFGLLAAVIVLVIETTLSHFKR